jgi:DNA-binding SARP family transcriptional activator
LPLLNVDNLGLALRAGVVVDLTLISEWAARLISGSPSNADLGILPSGVGALELLPGWYEDWVLLERERVRQRVLHAIDVQSRTLTQMGRYAEAVDAAMIAVASDPLRESAQFALIEAHLAEGNWTEGRRRFEAYQDLVRHELGSEPSAHLTALFNTVKKQSLGRVERLSALQYR